MPWADRHNVRLGATVELEGLALKLNTASIVISLLVAWKEFESQKYVWSLAELEDEHGQFNFGQEVYSGDFWGNVGGRVFAGSTRFYKSYISGEYQGREVDVSRSEFNSLREEHDALYGHGGVDDFTPGLLRPRLPKIYVDPLDSFRPRQPNPHGT